MKSCFLGSTCFIIMCLVAASSQQVDTELFPKPKRKISTFEKLISALPKADSESQAAVDQFKELFDVEWSASSTQDLHQVIEELSREEEVTQAPTPVAAGNQTASGDAEEEGALLIESLRPVVAAAYEVTTSVEVAPAANHTQGDVVPLAEQPSLADTYKELSTSQQAGFFDIGSLVLEDFTPSTYFPMPPFFQLLPPQSLFPAVNQRQVLPPPDEQRPLSPVVRTPTIKRHQYPVKMRPNSVFKFNIGKNIKKAIYPYYHKPRFRYPYYDEDGNGQLRYGYGAEDRLFEYKVFRPLQGYSRR